MARSRKRKEKRPARIVRLAWRLGWRPGRIVQEILEWLEVLVVAGALAALVMTFVTVRMHVPTGSMIPTIEIGDSFFVDRITYCFRDPKPGDIVVFRQTERVIVQDVDEGSPAGIAGLRSGQTLAALNGQHVYSTAFIESQLAAWPPRTPLLLITADGQQLSLGEKPTGSSTLAALGIHVREKRRRYVKRLIAVGGDIVQIVDGSLLVNGVSPGDTRLERAYTTGGSSQMFGTDPTLVPAHHFFVLGDNTDNSLDSRYWGFVARDDLIGVPYLRVWPLARFGPLR